MIRNYFLTALFGLTLSTTHAQELVGYLQSEVTVAGTQYGSSIIYETRSAWGGGVFYQSEIKSRPEQIPSKETFMGFVAQAPLAKSKRITFLGQLRAGLANNQFVVIVPGLETKLNITSRFGTSFGMSMRMGYPSLSGKIFVSLF